MAGARRAAGKQAVLALGMAEGARGTCWLSCPPPCTFFWGEESGDMDGEASSLQYKAAFCPEPARSSCSVFTLLSSQTKRGPRLEPAGEPQALPLRLWRPSPPPSPCLNNLWSELAIIQEVPPFTRDPICFPCIAGLLTRL